MVPRLDLVHWLMIFNCLYFLGLFKRKRPHKDNVEKFLSQKREIVKEFDELKDLTIEFLKAKKTDLAELKACVLPLSNPVYKMSQRERVDIFSTNQKAIGVSASIDDVFSRLAHFWSFIDFYLLKKIIKRFAPMKKDNIQTNNPSDIEINEKLEKYTENVKEFLRDWKVDSCRTFRVNDDLQGQEKVEIKIDTNEMAIYEGWKIAICDILKLKEGMLNICEVELGCIKLVFRCPDITVFAALRLPASQELNNQLKQIIPRILKITTVDVEGSECVVFEVGPI